MSVFRKFGKFRDLMRNVGNPEKLEDIVKPDCMWNVGASLGIRTLSYLVPRSPLWHGPFGLAHPIWERGHRVDSLRYRVTLIPGEKQSPSTPNFSQMAHLAFLVALAEVNIWSKTLLCCS